MEESEARPSRYANQKEEVGLDWTHLKEATIQHHTPGPNLECTGKEEKNTRRDTESELKEHDTTWQEAEKKLRTVFAGGLLLMAYVLHGTTDLSK
jgi:hypothetical protein